MRSIILSIFLIALSINLVGQQSVILHGTVIDGQNGISLPNAQVLIKNKQSAMVTDVDGKFNISLNNVQLEDSIIVSFIGYNTCRFSIASYLNRQDSAISLIPGEIVLKEVVISSRKPELLAFMKKAARAFEKSIRKTPHIAKGYYREKAKYDDRYVMFAESIGYAIYTGMRTPAVDYDFFCDNTRKSENKDQWKKLSSNGLNGEKLSDVTSLSNTTFRVFYDFNTFGPISEKNWNHYTYRLDSLYYVNNDELYSISFNQKALSGVANLARTQS